GGAGLTGRAVSADGTVDGVEPAGGGRDGIDDATAADGENTLRGQARRNPSDDAPDDDGGETQEQHAGEQPVERAGDANEKIQLLRRCGSLQRHRAKPLLL